MNKFNKEDIIKKFNNHEPHLIKLDIDGTSTNEDFATLNQKLKKVLVEIMKLGHKICFTTGRNYLSALPFYKEVGLDTFLITYNGGYICNPSKKEGPEVKNVISNKTVLSILNEPIIKKNTINVLIDREDLTTIVTSDDKYYQSIFFNGNPYIKGDIIKLLGEKDVLQLVLELPNDMRLFDQILMILRGKYSSSVNFYSGSKLKENKPGDVVLIRDPEKIVIKIRSFFASKGMGTKWTSSYYNIPLSNTIAFGNDDNDIELMMQAGKGIVTSDGSMHLKSLAYGITDSSASKNSDGVADFLSNYFKIEVK